MNSENGRLSDCFAGHQGVICKVKFMTPGTVLVSCRSKKKPKTAAHAVDHLFLYADSTKDAVNQWNAIMTNAENIKNAPNPGRITTATDAATE